MLKVVLKNLVRTKWPLQIGARAGSIRGHWPEPITQQTLDEFLEDINYFEVPKKFTNIGIDLDHNSKQSKGAGDKTFSDEAHSEELYDANKTQPSDIEKVLDILGQEAEAPSLDYDDCRLQGKQLVELAIIQGIYRDLFGKFTPDNDYIKFTPAQAERLSKFVPFYWITDQPFARVDRSKKESEPLLIFDPVIGISAKFINEQKSSQNQSESSDLWAHASYYGNIIPASEALNKPAITLDGRLLSSDGKQDFIPEKSFNNWTAGQVMSANFNDKQVDKYYSLALVNLDHLHENAANLHWMITNIQPSVDKTPSKYDEICEYLPVHGIRGFGYSRYVFIVFQHEDKMNTDNMKIHDFSLSARKFDATKFLHEHEDINMKPIGLSWFQTVWDQSSNTIFHDYLKLKAPVYEHIQSKGLRFPEHAYPIRLPFNIYLDHLRNKKEINEQVLLERLSTIDPLDYKDQYIPPRVPPTIHEYPDKPSWMRQVLFKKRNKIGYWRGLRPSSMSLPLDNNADLDYPIRPIASSKKSPPEFHNQYPGKGVKKMHKDMPTSKPVNEHQHVFIQDDHEVHLNVVRKVMEDFEKKKTETK